MKSGLPEVVFACFSSNILWQKMKQKPEALCYSLDLDNSHVSYIIGKDPDVGKACRQEEKGMTEDEMVRWHHRLNGHEFEQALGVGDAQVSLRVAVHGVAKSQTQLRD